MPYVTDIEIIFQNIRRKAPKIHCLTNPVTMQDVANLLLAAGGSAVMGQNEKVEKAPKTSWFSGLKAEFQKIIWPEKQSVIRQTVAVLAVSVVTGLIIALLDWGIQQGVDFLIGLHF